MSTLPHVSGIYKIVCVPTGKLYIGSTTNLAKRWRDHQRRLNGTYHHNSRLQNAWNKYGSSAFVFEIVELVAYADLVTREQYWLDKLQPHNKEIGFNIAVDTEAFMRGRKLTQEHRDKIGKAHRGKTYSPETRERISAGKKGRPLGSPSQEHRANLSVANKGKTKAPEHAEKVADTKRKLYIVTSPDGQEIEIKGMRRFCRLQGLDDRAMIRVAQGKQKLHKGWNCRYA